MQFYLGTHHPNWIRQTDVPLFLSARRLRDRKSRHPKAKGVWALDSGGFSELSLFGKWTISAEQYAEEACKWQHEIGQLQFAAIQDWMCEPFILEKTGLSVKEHQARTIGSYLELRELAPGVPWLPVLQGFSLDDYLAHTRQYEAAGIDLTSLPLVGLGSICRRQATREAEEIIAMLSSVMGIRLHGFGLKLQGLSHVGNLLASADSMAWSYAARRDVSLPGHEGKHKNCANCITYALAWRERVLQRIVSPKQLLLGF